MSFLYVNMLHGCHHQFFVELENACKRIIGMSGEHLTVRMKPTEYVISGYSITVTTNEGLPFPFWIGVNGPRLFFIAYVDATPEIATHAFQFCFGGARKVGWDVNYEKIDSGTSIWATCMTDRDRPLSGESITEEGRFWAADIAMMVQSWVRTCERNQIRRHKLEPAPL
jgi:hypothetical protein